MGAPPPTRMAPSDRAADDEPQLERRNAFDETIPASSAPPEDPPVTKQLPPSERYRLGAELGRGGMGRVVEAFDVQLGRTVALKEVLPKGGSGIARRFAREVQLTARLEHPSIVPLYDSGTTADGRPFYVMRRVTGRPLDEMIARAHGLGERLTLLPALLAAIDAIAHAHRRGVIHRDLKPANILVGELGETVVIDWGLAKVIGEEENKSAEWRTRSSAEGDAQVNDKTTSIAPADSLQTQIGSVFGTPGFMAPEQARGEEIGTRGDVYALGAILYQLLAGAPPHAGNSATEVIDKTRNHEVTPLADVAPGTPRELVAIVDKALAFDQEHRYPHAGALGEDVRRFLAGQLVAAHRYTALQKVSRFARRHRAPLVVAALATVAGAVLAWIGVHSIMTERDLANAARSEASAGQKAAEEARDQAQRNAERLTVMQARALLDRNPTHAAAVLAELPETSDRLADARAVAQAASVRGIAWAVQSTQEVTVGAELDREAKFLLQVSRDGMARVWDLDRRRLVVARPYKTDIHALWLGHVVLVTRKDAAPELLDPFSGSVQPLALGPIHDASASDAGDRFAYIDASGAAGVFEVAAKSARPLWPGHTPSDLVMSPNGAWIALGDAHAIEVLDPAGKELAHRDGRAQRLVVSRFDQLAIVDGDKLAVCTVVPHGTWQDVDLAGYRTQHPFDFTFRGRELDIYMSGGQLVGWNGKRAWQRMQLDGMTFRLLEAGPDVLVIPGNDGKLRFTNDIVKGELHLPLTLSTTRVVARGGTNRILVVGRGAIVGFDLGEMLPEPLEAAHGSELTFVDDATLLAWETTGGPWKWIDVATKKSIDFSYDPVGLVSLMDIDPTDGRVLVHESMGETSRLVLVQKNATTQKTLVKGRNVWGRFLPDGGLLFGVGDNRLFLAARGTDPRELVKLEGTVDFVVTGPRSQYFAVSNKGELVHGDIAAGTAERTHIEPGVTAIAIDQDGRPLLAKENRLLVWDHDVVQVTRTDRPINMIRAVDGGVLLVLSDHSVVRTTRAPGARIKPLLPASAKPPWIRHDGKLMLGESINGQVTIVELPSGATWDLPPLLDASELMSVTPSGRRVILSGFGRFAQWTLPEVGTELKTWVAEHTNAATDAEHVLVWPW